MPQSVHMSLIHMCDIIVFDQLLQFNIDSHTYSLNQKNLKSEKIHCMHTLFSKKFDQFFWG